MTASDPQVTTREEWLIARRELLAQEKELTRHRDRVSAARRALPMVEITKDYVFDGPDGRTGLADLFDGRGQLLIYHFMFEPDATKDAPPARSRWTTSATSSTCTPGTPRSRPCHARR